MNYWEGYYKNEFLYPVCKSCLCAFHFVLGRLFFRFSGTGGSVTRNAVGRKSTLQFQAKDPRH